MNDDMQRVLKRDDPSAESASVEADNEIVVDVEPESEEMRAVDESVERADW